MAQQRIFSVQLWNQSGLATTEAGVRFEWVRIDPDLPVMCLKLWSADGRESVFYPGKYAIVIRERQADDM